MIQTASKVEVYRCTEELEDVGDLPQWTNIVKGPILVPDERVARLREVLADIHGWKEGPSPACSPKIAIAYRFTKGKKSLYLLACFKCSQLLTAWNTKEADQWLLFDPYREDLLNLAIESFPDDKELIAARK